MRIVRHRVRQGWAVFCAAALWALGVGLGVAAAGGQAYVQPFVGSPGRPEPLRLADLDVVMHSRDRATWLAPEPVEAEHGPDCAPPPGHHHVASYDGVVFQCRDHVMTAINAGGYGAVYLTPSQLADWSGGEAVIQWDLSTTRSSDRDWVDVWVTPFEQQLEVPLDRWLPDGRGEPLNAVHARMDQFYPQGGTRQTYFRAEVVRDGVVKQVDGNWWTGYESFLTPSATVRSTFEVRVSGTHLYVGMPEGGTGGKGFAWIDAAIDPLPFTSGIVQLGHHSYTPTKACNYDGSCGPTTWHWDNLKVSPAVPFTLVKADRRYVNAASMSEPVHFAAPAPDGSFLRFEAVSGALPELSLDGGDTWRPAVPQRSTLPDDKVDVFRARTYWTPLPAGTEGVLVRAKGGYWGSDWIVRDLAVFAR